LPGRACSAKDIAAAMPYNSPADDLRRIPLRRLAFIYFATAQVARRDMDYGD
jgi:hypothetical protein